MIIAISIAVLVAVVGYVLFIRPADLPYVEPASPTGHLEERKAAIYENIRDANFEFLMGKLSQDDYQQTKTDLQKELADVNEEITRILGPAPAAPSAKPKGKGKEPTAPAAVATEKAPFVCPHCGTRFAQAMKFCGNCGKPMQAEVQA